MVSSQRVILVDLPRGQESKNSEVVVVHDKQAVNIRHTPTKAIADSGQQDGVYVYQRYRLVSHSPEPDRRSRFKFGHSVVCPHHTRPQRLKFRLIALRLGAGCKTYEV